MNGGALTKRSKPLTAGEATGYLALGNVYLPRLVARMTP